MFDRACVSFFPGSIPMPAPFLHFCKGLTTLSAEAMYWLRRADSLSVLCVSSAVTAVGTSGAAHVVAKLREMRLYLTGTIIQFCIVKLRLQLTNKKDKSFPTIAPSKKTCHLCSVVLQCLYCGHHRNNDTNALTMVLSSSELAPFAVPAASGAYRLLTCYRQYTCFFRKRQVFFYLIRVCGNSAPVYLSPVPHG